MTNKIEYKYNHWHLPDDLRALLMECVEPGDQQHSLKGVDINCHGIFVANDVLVATDRRRLIEVSMTHGIKPGLWFCTGDGWLLNKLSGEFVPYTQYIPTDKELRRLVRIPGCDARVLSIVLGKLVEADCIPNIETLYKPMALLWNLDMQDVELFVHKHNTSKEFFILTGKTHYGPIRYLQMPIPLVYETE